MREAWRDSDAFNRYRGQGWMNSTCGDCDERGHDFGGCRCQAFLVTGDAAATDPVCPKSEHRDRIDAVLAAADDERAQAARGGGTAQPLRFVPGAAQRGAMIYRSDENSLALHAAGAAPC